MVAIDSLRVYVFGRTRYTDSGACHAVDGLSKRRVDTERVEWER
jgi:hypothetical protein